MTSPNSSGTTKKTYQVTVMSSCVVEIEGSSVKDVHEKVLKDEATKKMVWEALKEQGLDVTDVTGSEF